jgi:acyl-CoA thioesterase I
MRTIGFLLLFLFSGTAFSATVLVVGDSISAAYGLAEKDGWVSLAEEAFQAEDDKVTFINASISGDTTSGGVARLPEALERFQPDIVVIELGGNDGLRGYSLKDMRENLTTMVMDSEAAGAEVLLLGMQIPTNYGVAYTRRFTEIFQKVADATGAALVPFFLEPIATSRDFFQRDGVHPTAEAQPLMFEHAKPALQELIERVTVAE